MQSMEEPLNQLVKEFMAELFFLFFKLMFFFSFFLFRSYFGRKSHVLESLAQFLGVLFGATFGGAAAAKFERTEKTRGRIPERTHKGFFFVIFIFCIFHFSLLQLFKEKSHF